MVKGVFFDLGGTLFDYTVANKPIGAALSSALEKLGADSPGDIGKAYGRASKEVTLEFASLDYFLHADLFEETFKRAVGYLNLQFSAEVYAEFRDAQHRAIVEGMALKEDCKATLQQLKDAGLYLSIISNIDDDMLMPLVERESLDTWLDHWTSSESAQSCKPHERFFNVGLELAGLSAADVLFVGDSPEHDVNGASAVGMRTALIRNGDLTAPLQSGKATVDPDHVIERLGELPEIIGV